MSTIRPAGASQLPARRHTGELPAAWNRSNSGFGPRANGCCSSTAPRIPGQRARSIPRPKRFVPIVRERQCGDRHRHRPLAVREALHLVADVGPEEQNLRRPPPQLSDPAVRQSRRRDPPHDDHEPRHTDRTRRPSIGAWPLASASRRPLLRRRESSPSWSIEPYGENWSIVILVPRLTTISSTRASCVGSASASPLSASSSSAVRLVSYSVE